MEYRMNVQCTDETTGIVGTFITNAGEHRAISPIFPSVADLYNWMRLYGWKSEEWVNGQSIPWRVVKV